VRLLITGFEPFGGEAYNPSQACLPLLAEALARRGIGVQTAVLPVEIGRVPQELHMLLHDYDPDIYLGLGLAGGRPSLSIERVGVNVLDFEMPDNAGTVIQDEPIATGGPAAYFSTLPVRAMAQASSEAHVPMYVSNTAGAYLCNAALYLGLHWAHTANRPTVPGIGFIHLPFAAESAPRRPAPALPLEFMARGIGHALMAALEAGSAHPGQIGDQG
jgi:pyroglutamyl-peptidase